MPGALRLIGSALLFAGLIAFLLAGCSSPAAPSPFRLAGVWGGVMNSGGVDVAAFAMDVTTDVSGSTGSVVGYGVLSDGTGEVYVSVTGTTQPSDVRLTLTDALSDTIALDGSIEGALIRGSWSYPAGGLSGSMRMAREENIDLLALGYRATDPNTAASDVLDDLF